MHRKKAAISEHVAHLQIHDGIEKQIKRNLHSHPVAILHCFLKEVVQ